VNSKELIELVKREWRRALQVGDIDDRDDFFELGGNSLLALEVVAQLRFETGIEVPLGAWMFEHPTPTAIARYIHANLELQA
jgi:acyl carrier protein